MEPEGLFDTNILIDALNGVPQARSVILQYVNPAISVVTWIEVMAGLRPGSSTRTERFLDTFRTMALTSEIAKRAAAIRQSTRLKLPDAVILATASAENRVLLTRNTRDFTEDRWVRIPYTL